MKRSGLDKLMKIGDLNRFGAKSIYVVEETGDGPAIDGA